MIAAGADNRGGSGIRDHHSSQLTRLRVRVSGPLQKETRSSHGEEERVERCLTGGE